MPAFFNELLAAERFPLKSFEEAIRKGVQVNSHTCFESCLPIEILAERGPLALIFSPLRPVGIPDPRSTERPYAIVQIRQDNIATTLFNLIGCQTNLTCKEQENLFLAGQITGIEGYAWNIASVLVAGFNSNRMLKSLPALVLPLETMIGSLLHYITYETPDSFQLMKANFGLLLELEHQVHKKKDKKFTIARRALRKLASFCIEKDVYC